ncbi:unnamed protein product [Amoebophrya sp. A25]|nr:unnamed protein product [Amoebophrya sp. A25]|eukprot:GSA25T00001441001.1
MPASSSRGRGRRQRSLSSRHSSVVSDREYAKVKQRKRSRSPSIDKKKSSRAPPAKPATTRSNSRGRSRNSRRRSRGRSQNRSSNKNSIYGKSVLIRNLPQTTTKEDLETEFLRFGDVDDVHIPLDYNTRKQKSFAFIKFAERDAAEDAIARMDGTDFKGNVISLTVAEDRRKSPNTMRRICASRDSRDRGGRDRGGRDRGRDDRR